jgi:hypothetical protein
VVEAAWRGACWVVEGDSPPPQAVSSAASSSAKMGLNMADLCEEWKRHSGITLSNLQFN